MQVALKMVPDDNTFITLLLAKEENLDTLKEEMQALISLLGPFLEEIHSILVSPQSWCLRACLGWHITYLFFFADFVWLG